MASKALSPPSSGWTSQVVRKTFIDFFQEKNHTFWHSSSVIPFNDPTLLFINAGMNQFKPHFLGALDPSTDMSKLKRAANSQKCIRAGGKHNDLDDVGKDVYHHTFFEMLGNWSFGDYFKVEAIDFAVSLLVDTFGIDKSRLYATYFGGDAKLPNCPPDHAARDIWLKYLPANRVLPFGHADNFWEMAETGPCGPCSEVHYDRIGGRDAADLVNKDDPDVLEIWNLVFMQFNRESSGFLSPLPAPCVDTGMGFERLLSILQGVPSNYDTDIFKSIFLAIQQVTGCTHSYKGKVGLKDEGKIDMSYRVIADHIRCLCVAIADGAEPSNEGRGYVLRRILRRALRYGKQFLEASEGVPWLYKLADSVSETLSSFYPELDKKINKIKEVIKAEEIVFIKTLDRGVKRFNRVVSSLVKEGSTVFPGSDAFILYTSYGFPLDLTQLMAAELNLTVDDAGFELRFKEHQASSEGKNFKAEVDFALGPEQLHWLRASNIAGTDDSTKYLMKYSPIEKFSQTLSGISSPSATLCAIYDGSSFQTSATSESLLVGLVLNSTCFYAEQGGQIGDSGSIVIPSGEAVFDVRAVKKYGEFVLHVGSVLKGTFAVNSPVMLKLNTHRRFSICQNHTATHLLNFALRRMLGVTTDQRGSVVEASRLRFDFSCGSQVELPILEEVETIVQEMIREELEVYTQEVPLHAGKAINGLRAVFGEHYPDPVRVVSIGLDVEKVMASPEEPHGLKASIEFCGGTHVSNSCEIENFAILSEESISKGIRRIVSVSGTDAVNSWYDLHKYQAQFESFKDPSNSVKFEALVRSLKAQVEEQKDLPIVGKRRLLQEMDAVLKKALEEEKVMAKRRLQNAKQLGAELGAEHKGKKFVVVNVPALGGDGKALDIASQAFALESPKVPFMLLTKGEMSGSCVCIVPAEYAPKMNAVQWINAAMAEVNGKGGGNAGRAVGSSKQMADVSKALEAGIRYAESSV